MAKKNGCKFPGCCDTAETEDLCAEHYDRWRSSDDWRNIWTNEKVRGWASLGLKDMAMKEVSKLRRKWAKREADAGR